MAIGSGEKSWLILSLKWSRQSENLMWYRPNSSGYTDDILKAGLYHEHEVESICDGENTVGVPCEVAHKRARTMVFIQAGQAIAEELRKASEESRS